MAALGQPMTLLRTGDTFNAILVDLKPLDPRLDLGSDWREMCTIEARRDQIPQTMRADEGYGDIVRQANPPWNTSEFTEFPLWKLIRREDNGARFTIMFWAARVPKSEEDRVLLEVSQSPVV
jgi:hypothetical protein